MGCGSSAAKVHPGGEDAQKEEEIHEAVHVQEEGRYVHPPSIPVSPRDLRVIAAEEEARRWRTEAAAFQWYIEELEQRLVATRRCLYRALRDQQGGVLEASEDSFGSEKSGQE